MAIPAEHKGRFVYQFTHLRNLSSILKYGLLSCNEKDRLGIQHVSIAEKSIQERRAKMRVTCGPDGVVHDYVPFYFCKRSSMLLAVVNAKNVDQQHLIYFAYPIEIIERPDVVFTDASANTVDPPNFYSDPVDLARLKWKAIDSLKWKMSSDAEKQARMAEVLIHKCLSARNPSYIVVWNEWIREQVVEAYKNAALSVPEIVYDPHFYYTKWPEANLESLVTGPFFTMKAYKRAVKAVKEALAAQPQHRFNSPTGALTALREDMSCIPEVEELIGLATDNTVHKDDVGTHTLKVVKHVRQSEEYRQLGASDKELIELAAFFHDIGKGPKSRWIKNAGKQKGDPDHAIRSAEMLTRILSEEIGGLSLADAKTLLRLVCYHDLVGDIVAKGRDEKQLDKICKNIRVLTMLTALGKADMAAINPLWITMYGREISALQKRVCERMGFVAGA